MFQLGLRELEHAPCQPAPDARRETLKASFNLVGLEPTSPRLPRGVLATNTKGVAFNV